MRTLVLGLILLLLGTPLSAAQAPTQAPPVVFEDAAIEDRIVPLQEPGTTEIPIEIGCDTLETPETTTIATFNASAPDASVNPVLSPSTHEWTTGPQACTTNPGGTPHTGEIMVSIGVTQATPAFSTITVPIEMTITKTAPTTESSTRTYGPYQANVTAQAGYYGLYNVRAQDKIGQIPAGESAQFGLEIHNFANGETRFALTPPQASNVNVTVEPRTFTLGPQQLTNVTIHARPTDTAQPGDHLPLTVTIESESAKHPGTGHEALPTQTSYLLQIRSNTTTGSSPLDAIPALPAPLIPLALLAAAFLAARRHPKPRAP